MRQLKIQRPTLYWRGHYTTVYSSQGLSRVRKLEERQEEGKEGEEEGKEEEEYQDMLELILVLRVWVALSYGSELN